MKSLNNLKYFFPASFDRELAPLCRETIEITDNETRSVWGCCKFLTLLILLTFTLINCSTVKDIPPKAPVVYYQRPSSDPNTMSIDLYTMGELAFNEGNFQLAARLFQQASMFDYKSVTIKERLLETYLVMAEVDTSLYAQIIVLGDEYHRAKLATPQIYRLKGYAHFNREQNEEGLKMMKLALDLDPSPYHYFDYFVYLGRYSEKLEFIYLEKALEKSWGKPELIYAIAQIYEHYRPIRTKEILERAYKLYDDDEELLTRLVEFYIRFLDLKSFNTLIETRIEQGKPTPQLYHRTFVGHLFYMEEYSKLNEIYTNFRDTEDDVILTYFLLAAYDEELYSRVVDIGKMLLNGEEITSDDNNLITVMVGSSLYLLQNYPQAIKYFAAIEDPFLLYKTFKDINEKVEALHITAIVEDMIAEGFSEVLANLLLTIWYLSEEDTTETRKYLQKAIVSDGVEDKIWQALAVILLDTDMVDEAFSSLAKVNEEGFKANVFIGDFYYQIEEDSLAIHYFKKSIESETEPSANLYASLASVYNRNKQHQKELELMEEAIQIHPENATILNWFGYTLVIHTTRYKEAEEYLLKAIEMRPDSPHIQDSVAWLYYKLQDYEKALYYMEDIIETGVTDSIISYHIGMIYLQLQELEQAAEYLQWAIELDNDEEAVNSAKEVLSSMGASNE